MRRSRIVGGVLVVAAAPAAAVVGVLMIVVIVDMAIKFFLKQSALRWPFNFFFNFGCCYLRIAGHIQLPDKTDTGVQCCRWDILLPRPLSVEQDSLISSHLHQHLPLPFLLIVFLYLTRTPTHTQDIDWL